MSLSFEPEETAELYFHTPGAGSRRATSYRRFASMAAAASFVMKEVSSRDRSSCILEFDGQRLGFEDIRKLYEGADMKPKVNYRAERAERNRKKEAKKDARLAALSKNKEAEVAPLHAPNSVDSLPKVHRSSS